MLDQSVRSAILLLKDQGKAIRAIARILELSRVTVRRVLEAGTAEIPEFDRVEKGEAHKEEILELLKPCKGNLVRVHEKLVDAGQKAYRALKYAPFPVVSAPSGMALGGGKGYALKAPDCCALWRRRHEERRWYGA